MFAVGTVLPQPPRKSALPIDSRRVVVSATRVRKKRKNKNSTNSDGFSPNFVPSPSGVRVHCDSL